MFILFLTFILVVYLNTKFLEIESIKMNDTYVLESVNRSMLKVYQLHNKINEVLVLNYN